MPIAYRTAALTLVIITSCLAFLPGALAGGVGEHDDENDNLKYFGFVKDGNGRFVSNAQVVVTIKGSASLSAASDSTGAYKIPIPRLLPGVAPENITVTCSKNGFRHVRSVVRSNINQKPLLAVEVECTLNTAVGQ